MLQALVRSISIDANLRRAASFVAALLVMIFSGPLAARAPTTPEKAQLTAGVAEFTAALKAKNFDGVLKVMPLKIIPTIAEQAKIPPDELRKAMVGLMTDALAKVTIDRFSIDLANAEYRELPDGAPYAVIPTVTEMSLSDGRRFKEQAQTVGFLEEGIWRLIRVSDDQQLAILRQAYPAFAKVEIAKASLELVK